MTSSGRSLSRKECQPFNVRPDSALRQPFVFDSWNLYLLLLRELAFRSPLRTRSVPFMALFANAIRLRRRPGLRRS